MSLENVVLVHLPTFSPGLPEGQYRHLVQKGACYYDGKGSLHKKDKLVLVVDGRHANVQELYETLCRRERIDRQDFLAVIVDPGFTPGAKELMAIGFGVEGVHGDRVVLRPRKRWWNRKITWKAKCYYLYEPVLPEHISP